MIEKIKKSYFLEEEDIKNIKIQMIKLNINKMSDLANILGVSNSYISSIFKCKKSFSYKFIEKLSEIGVEINYDGKR